MSYESHKYYNGNLYASIAKDDGRCIIMMEGADIIKLLKTCTIFLICI